MIAVISNLGGILNIPLELQQYGLILAPLVPGSTATKTITVTSVQQSDQAQISPLLRFGVSIEVSVNCGHGIIVNSTGPINCPALVAQKTGA